MQTSVALRERERARVQKKVHTRTERERRQSVARKSRVDFNEADSALVIRCIDPGEKSDKLKELIGDRSRQAEARACACRCAAAAAAAAAEQQQHPKPRGRMRERARAGFVRASLGVKTGYIGPLRPLIYETVNRKLFGRSRYIGIESCTCVCPRFFAHMSDLCVCLYASRPVVIVKSAVQFNL